METPMPTQGETVEAVNEELKRLNSPLCAVSEGPWIIIAAHGCGGGRMMWQDQAERVATALAKLATGASAQEVAATIANEHGRKR